MSDEDSRRDADASTEDPTGLPEGWTRDMRKKTVWEFRCPDSDVCDRGRCRKLYTKDSYEQCCLQGAYHLYDRQKHPEALSWPECEARACAGVTEEEWEYEIWIDENGEEHDAYQKRNQGKGGGGGGGGKGAAKGVKKGGGGGRGRDYDRRDNRDRDRRSRSNRRSGRRTESPRRDRRECREISRGERERLIEVVPLTRAPAANEVIISRTEVDELIDLTGRASQAIGHCKTFFESAIQTMEGEQRIVNEVKFALERLRRAAS